MEPCGEQRLFQPVSKSESGQKLLQFLGRRLDLPQSLLHRWIRTGQVRLNGKRCKAFCRVAENDAVRLPPLAEKLSGNREYSSREDIIPDACSCGLNILGVFDDIMVINKPYGMPVHKGTGHKESIAGLLARFYRDEYFTPVPAHRLDRDTSGLLLAATSWQALRRLQDAFASRLIHKEYLCWVTGEWPYARDVFLAHYLRREGMAGSEKIVAHDKEKSDSRKAELLVRRLESISGQSLLQIRLFTGRKHQIRVQLAHMGYPVLGDVKYGALRLSQMFLHAFRLILPEGREFVCLPEWKGAQNVKYLPCAMADMQVKKADSQ